MLHNIIIYGMKPGNMTVSGLHAVWSGKCLSCLLHAVKHGAVICLDIVPSVVGI